MCRQLFYSISSFVLVLVLAGNAQAATYQWDNGGAGSLWNVPENWEPDGLPGSADEAHIDVQDANCVIDSSVVAECSALYVNSNGYLEMTGGSLSMDGFLAISDDADANSLMVMSGGVANMGTMNMTNGRLRVGYRGIGTLIMTGGEMNVYDKIEIGRQTGAVGTVYMYGGTMNFADNSTDLELGTNGTGIFYQYGGVVNVYDYIKLTQNNPESVARLYLYGGVMTADDLRDPEDTLGDPLMDITEGTLILTGDDRERVNIYLNNGWIVAYDDLGIVDVNYTEDPNQTVLTGVLLDPELARKPNPSNGEVDVPRDAVLNWISGSYADKHNVYFGTDVNDVNEATQDNPLDVLVSIDQEETTYTPSEPLELNQTYYWRVDEVNDAEPNSPWKGNIWSFTIANYIVIEDFEDYNDYEPDTVWNTWADGYDDPTNGSSAGYPEPDFFGGGHYLEDEIVHSGDWSMPLFYDNSSAMISEVTKTLNADWATEGFATLTLWYNGLPFNIAEPMYVALNGNAVVTNNDASAALVTEWTQWDIPLQAFVDQGVDLANVGTLSIGFGNKANPVRGGAGNVFIDDIRLYLP